MYITKKMRIHHYSSIVKVVVNYHKLTDFV